MSRLMLCREEKAIAPYYIETIGKNIYTIEELCFYYRNYGHLLEKSALDKKLVSWIRTELKLDNLADKMNQMIQNEDSIGDMVIEVFSSVGYLSEQECDRYLQELKQMKHMTQFERNKRKADDLVKNKKFYKAVQEYRMLLKEPEAKEEEIASKLYHNLGVAYSKMFFFKKGADCFLKAFLMTPNKESMRQYKLAARLCEEEIEEDQLVKQFPNSESMDLQIYQEMEAVSQQGNGKRQEVEQLKQLKNEGKIANYYQMMEEILQKWREECRDYMNIR